MDSGGHNSVHSVWEKSSAMFLEGWTRDPVQGLALGAMQGVSLLPHPPAGYAVL